MPGDFPYWNCSCRHADTKVYYADEIAKLNDEVLRLTELLRAYEGICARYQAVFAIKYKGAPDNGT